MGVSNGIPVVVDEVVETMRGVVLFITKRQHVLVEQTRGLGRIYTVPTGGPVVCGQGGIGVVGAHKVA